MIALVLLLAAQSPYTDRTALPIKSLTPEAVEAYRNGTGYGMAIPAELNGYPGPRHVLDMAKKLELTEEQRAKVQSIYDGMHADAVKIGGEIIDLEQKLDSAFAHSSITDRELASLTREIAERQGKLRAVHLQAHLATKAILTQAQVESYKKLRGYEQHDPSMHHHVHG